MAHLDSNKVQQSQTEILEQGDIYFFYRPKKAATEEVKGIEDVRRFFMVTTTRASYTGFLL